VVFDPSIDVTTCGIAITSGYGAAEFSYAYPAAGFNILGVYAYDAAGLPGPHNFSLVMFC
jgi:hypothetical protein